MLQALQHMPNKEQLQLLLFANAVSTHKNRWFIVVLAESGVPINLRQHSAGGFNPISLEIRVGQDLAAVTQVLHPVRLHPSMFLLQPIKGSLLIGAPLLLKDTY